MKNLLNIQKKALENPSAPLERISKPFLMFSNMFERTKNLLKEMSNMLERIKNLFEEMSNMFGRTKNLFEEILNMFERIKNGLEEMLNMFEKPAERSAVFSNCTETFSSVLVSNISCIKSFIMEPGSIKN
jgi:archaellum component FlaC